MQKKVIKILTVFLLTFNHVYSQTPSIEWQKCYGSGGGQICYCIKPTSDGGSISCGTSRVGTAGGDISIVYGNDDAWILKLDVLGTIMWDKSIGGTASKHPYGIQQTADGGYIVAGDRDSIGGSDYWIAKLNSGGSIVWQKTYGGTGGDFAYSIEQTTDGGYIIAGQTLSSDGDITGYHGAGDCWIIKLDIQGNLVWQKALGGSTQEIAYDVKQTPDGGYIVSGSTSSIDGDVINPLHYSGAVWIIKLDANGNITWQKLYGSVFGYSICLTSDGGYAFTSDCFNNTNGGTGNHGVEDYWIVKLDASGNLVWEKTLGGSNDDQPRSIIQTVDGGYIVAGRTSSLNGDVTGNHGNFDFWVVKVSATGGLEWTKTMGGVSQESAYSIFQTPDLGYMVAGSSTSNNDGDVGTNHGEDDFWIVKLAPEVLPVTLVNFDANVNGKNVICEWKTSQEQNSSHFIIERSDDALHFIEIGRVNAAGNSALSIVYHFVDQNALLANRDYFYYRLKMVDLDGSFKNSHVVKIGLKDLSSLSIYPNPVKNQLTINFVSQFSEQTNLVIYNNAGIKVYYQPMMIIKGNNSLQLDIHSLPHAGYYLSFGDQREFQGSFIKAN